MSPAGVAGARSPAPGRAGRGPGPAGNRDAAGCVDSGVDLDLPFRGTDAVRAGEIGRRARQGPHFRALGPGVFVRATTVVDVRVRSLAALTAPWLADEDLDVDEWDGDDRDDDRGDDRDDDDGGGEED